MEWNRLNQMFEAILSQYPGIQTEDKKWDNILFVFCHIALLTFNNRSKSSLPFLQFSSESMEIRKNIDEHGVVEKRFTNQSLVGLMLKKCVETVELLNREPL